MGAPDETAPRTARKTGASARGAARLLAVQALYQLDLRGGTPDATIMEFLEHRTELVDDDDETRVRLEADKALFADLVRGVVGAKTELERALDGALDGKTTVERLEPLLRAIMKAGVYELRSRSDIPAKATISEYVHLTDAFFDGREPGLVNAVLDRLARVMREDEVAGVQTDGGDGTRH